MKTAPYLLQAFASRILATKEVETVSRAELAHQSYDVETLIDMIEAYNALPESERGFIVTYSESEIRIQRKANSSVPAAGEVDAKRGARHS